MSGDIASFYWAIGRKKKAILIPTNNLCGIVNFWLASKGKGAIYFNLLAKSEK
jgi:hypothetical protein